MTPLLNWIAYVNVEKTASSVQPPRVGQLQQVLGYVTNKSRSFFGDLIAQMKMLQVIQFVLKLQKHHALDPPATKRMQEKVQ
jgi:hypothetical protein